MIRTPSDQAERRYVDRTLGRAQHDPRDGTTFAADLARETVRSLQLDPGRWPWTAATGYGWSRRGGREDGDQP